MYITPTDHVCSKCDHVFKFSVSWTADGSHWPVTFDGGWPACPKCWDKMLRDAGVGMPKSYVAPTNPISDEEQSS